MAKEPIGEKTRLDEEGKTVPNEERIGKGSKGTIKEIDEKGTSIEWRSGDQVVTTYLNNEQRKHIDHGYAKTASKEQDKAKPNEGEIVGVSEQAVGAFQQEAANLASSESKRDAEIVTTCREEMLKAVGKEPEKSKRKSRDAERKTEKSIEADRDNGRDEGSFVLEPQHQAHGFTAVGGCSQR